jgi:N-glycosylase/DNA lyase
LTYSGVALMKVTLIDTDTVELKASGFDLYKTLTCGQCFRWHHEGDGSFTGVVNGKCVNVSQSPGGIALYPGSLHEAEQIWAPYFDLQKDYQRKNCQILAAAPWMKLPVETGDGIHLLKQDPWETTVSFMISANNHIRRITGIIENLSTVYGTPLGTFGGRMRFAFPTPEQLMALGKQEWELCGTGYRSTYLLKAVRLWGEVYSQIERMKYKKNQTEESAVRELLETLPGVGPKVSACVALFGFGESRQFPVDVWVRRIVNTYWSGIHGSDREIENEATKLFGENAGYAQQLLFYTARVNRNEILEGAQ